MPVLWQEWRPPGRALRIYRSHEKALEISRTWAGPTPHLHSPDEMGARRREAAARAWSVTGIPWQSAIFDMRQADLRALAVAQLPG